MTGQNKGRYHEQELSLLLISLVYKKKLHLEIPKFFNCPLYWICLPQLLSLRHVTCGFTRMTSTWEVIHIQRSLKSGYFWPSSSPYDLQKLIQELSNWVGIHPKEHFLSFGVSVPPFLPRPWRLRCLWMAIWITLMPGPCSGNFFISILVTYYIQKRIGQALLFSFEYNLLPNLISNFNHYMDTIHWIGH